MNHAVNWEAISAIGQIVGAIAVVISLIYLAREVRSSAHATQLASRHSMEDIFIRWSQQLADNQNLREVYYRGLHDFESLEGDDLANSVPIFLLTNQRVDVWDSGDSLLLGFA